MKSFICCPGCKTQPQSTRTVLAAAAAAARNAAAVQLCVLPGRKDARGGCRESPCGCCRYCCLLSIKVHPFNSGSLRDVVQDTPCDIMGSHHGHSVACQHPHSHNPPGICLSASSFSRASQVGAWVAVALGFLEAHPCVGPCCFALCCWVPADQTSLPCAALA